jgi:hypothetical protein
MVASFLPDRSDAKRAGRSRFVIDGLTELGEREIPEHAVPVIVQNAQVVGLAQILHDDFKIRNGTTLRLQAVFSPCTADALTGRLTGPETLRVALKPLKAANQPGPIEKIFNQGAPLYIRESRFRTGLNALPPCL